MSVLFTSDLHLGHKYAARLRGFDTVDEHDLAVIESFKGYLTRRTVIWVLGDVAFTSDGLELMHELPGNRRLIFGNHDKFHIDYYRKIFHEIHGFLRYKNMWLSHAPIHPQELYRCAANVHGHIHKNAATPELEFPYINVNWDFWRRPVTLDEIRDTIAENATTQEPTWTE